MYKKILTESNQIDTLMVSKNLIQTLKFEMDNDPMIRDLVSFLILRTLFYINMNHFYLFCYNS